MRRRPALLASLLAMTVVAGFAAPAAATVRGQEAAPNEPQAWILADATSGAVLGAKDPHRAMPPSTAATVMTALTVLQRLPLNPIEATQTNQVLVSEAATKVPKPRLGVLQGSKYALTPLLNGMLLGSANDAAYALAEGASGSVPAFVTDMNTLSRQLGLRDSAWTDPIGDDDDAGTPNRTSAWDLAVLARAAVADPDLSDIVKGHSEIVNGPGLGRTIRNDNDLVSRYLGATGVKEGLSKAAGGVLVGTASRGNRTLIVVALNSPDPVAWATAQLDQGFAAPAATGTGGRLPLARASSAQGRLEALANLPGVLGRPDLKAAHWGPGSKPLAVAPTTTTPKSTKPSHHGGGGDGVFTLTNVLIALLLAGLVVVIVLRRRAIVVRQQRRVVRQRTLAEARRRGTLDFVEPDQVSGTGHVRVVRSDKDPPR